MDVQNCRICKRSNARTYPGGAHDALTVECELCGKYTLFGSQIVAAAASWPEDIRKPLSCATRQASETGECLWLTLQELDKHVSVHSKPRVGANLHKLLGIAAKRASRPHIGAWFYYETDFTVIDCFSPDEFEWYVEWLKNKNWVFQTGAGPKVAQLTLSLEGWNAAQPSLSVNGIPGRCFVAMWFSGEMQLAYDAGIAQAVRDAGYDPIRIDNKEHNNEIPDEIMSEIRNSEFVIADFTGQRAGVYYEAGFAMGLGKKVIWCCRKDEIDKLHFDTSHKNHIVWEGPDDLKPKLYKRIRATIVETK